MSRNSRAGDSSLCFDLENSQRLYLCVEREPILEEKISVLAQRVSNLEKENDLLKRETEYQERLTELAEKKAELYEKAFLMEKDLTDRSLKLAEISKPKLGIFAIIGGIVAAFVLGLAVGL